MMKLTIRNGEVLLDEKNITNAVRSLEVAGNANSGFILKLALKCDSDVELEVDKFILQNI